MKKNHFISLLAIVGTIISGALLLQHFNPAINLGLMSCGNGLINPCAVVSKATFSTLLGIPLAALGIFFYLLILFSSFIEERHFLYPVMIILPISIFGIITDAILAVYMYTLGQVCFLCIITYGITALIAFFSILICKDINKITNKNFPDIAKEIFDFDKNKNNKKFILIYIALSILLFIAIIATTFVMKTNYSKNNNLKKENRVESYINKIYEKEREDIDFGENGLVLGNPDAEVSIIAFTDFLCSACNHLYKIEKQILKKFGDRVNIVYYNFPLDLECNKSISRTVYKKSCDASRSVIAAHELGVLSEYLKQHFEDYEMIHHGYRKIYSVDVLDKILKEQNISVNKITKKINSSLANSLIQEHIELANELNVQATPTIYINGLRMDGVPNATILIKIIEKELQNK